MSQRIGVLLSGSGVYDGTEIQEAVLVLLALDRRGARAVLCAPDAAQANVVDHLSREASTLFPRNVLSESARIGRGQVRNVARVNADELDGLVIPGGFGAIKNLCDFARKGPRCLAEPGVARLVRDLHEQRKPIVALGMAAIVLASVLGHESPTLTVGDDVSLASALEEMGAAPLPCRARETVVDHGARLVTTPAYLVARRISDLADAIDRGVGEMMALVPLPEPALA
jgi:enhancing lycopene biosynthesis protein 2